MQPHMTGHAFRVRTNSDALIWNQMELFRRAHALPTVYSENAV